MKHLAEALKTFRKPLVEGRGIKVFALTEGTWSAPQTLSQARRLNNLMNKGPLTAAELKDRIYELVGDDDTFDRLDNFEKRHSDEDARWIVVAKVRDWLKNIDKDGWRQPWDPEAIKLLKLMVRRHAM